MRDLFSIGEMAKLFNINIRTLRYYDKIGLLKPEYVDDKSNYRYYGTKQFEKLNTIRYLRALDMPIEKISEFFEHKDVNVMISLLKNQKEISENKKKELDLIERKINNRIKQIEEASSWKLEEISIRNFPERKALVLKSDIPVNDDLEYSIRKLERNHNLNSSVFLGKIGVRLSAENIQNMNYNSFSSIFMLIEDEDLCQSPASIINKGEYIFIRFCGTHVDSPTYYKKLMDYMKDNKFEISGDSLEITYIDSGLTEQLGQFVTEIEIPFKRA